MVNIKKLFKKIYNGELLVKFFPSLSFYILRKKYLSLVWELSEKKLPLILRLEYGGLGDYLVYSSLPEALFRKYGVKTQISLQSDLRSQGIKAFVWDANPYVSFSPEKGIFVLIPRLNEYENYNEILLALFSVQAPLFSVYYEQNPRPDVSNKIICDFTGGPSMAHNGYNEPAFWGLVSEYIKANFNVQELLLIDPSEKYVNKNLMNYIKETLGITTVSTSSINELADLICSAKGRIMLDSGAKSVAAAYGKASIILSTKRVDKYFRYPGNTYIEL